MGGYTNIYLKKLKGDKNLYKQKMTREGSEIEGAKTNTSFKAILMWIL